MRRAPALMLTSLMLTALMSSAPASAHEARGFEKEVLSFALDACTTREDAQWLPARRSEYLDEVVDYHHRQWDKQNVRGGIAAFELLNEDGDLIDVTLPSGEIFQAILIKTAVHGRGARALGCGVYVTPYEAISLEEMRQWSGSEPSEKLIGVALNESSWILTPPDGSGWDHAIVSAFDTAVPQSPNATPHPFRGVVIRFTKTEF